MNEIVEIWQHFDHWVFQPHSSLLRQAPAGPCWPVKTERWLKFLQRALSFQPAPVTYATIQNPQNSDIHSCSTGISKCLLLHYPRNWKLSSQAVAACWVVLELKVKILYPGPLLEPGSPAICAGVVPTELSRTSTDLWQTNWTRVSRCLCHGSVLVLDSSVVRVPAHKAGDLGSSLCPR